MINGSEDSDHARLNAPGPDFGADSAQGGFDAPSNTGQAQNEQAGPDGPCHAIVLSDENQIVTYWSAGAEKMFGWRADEVVGKPVPGLVQAEYPGCPREKAFARIMRKGWFQSDAVLRHKDGSPVFANIHSAVLPGENGKPGGAFVLFQDIRHRIQQQGSRNADWEQRNDAVAMADNNQIAVYWNAAAEKLFGWRADEVLGKPIAGILGPEHPGHGRERAFAQMNESGCFQGEALLMHKNGSPVYADIYASVRRGDGGEILGSFTIFREISGHRKIEDAPPDRGEYKDYLDIVDSPTTGTFVHNLQKGEAYYSTAWKKRLGAENLSPAQMADLPARVVHPDDMARMIDLCRKAEAIRAARISLDVRVKTVNLGYRWIHGEARIQYGKSGEAIRYIGTQTDVTEQRAMTENLHFQADVLAGVHEVLAAIGQDGKVCYWNHMAEMLSGIPAHDILGMDEKYLLGLSLVTYEDGTRIKQSMDATGVFVGEVKVYGKNGALAWGDAHIKYTGAEGGFRGVVISFRDITERKQAEEQLAFQANLLASANEGILFVDSSYVITYWNAGAEKQYGWTAEEALGQKVQELLRVQSPKGSLKEYFKLLIKEGSWYGEVLCSRKDGQQIWIESYTRALQDGQGNFLGYVNSTRDITRRKYRMAVSERRNAVLKAINRVYREYVACETMEQLGKVCLHVAQEVTGSTISLVGEIDEKGMFHNVVFSDEAWKSCTTGKPEPRDLTGGFPAHGLFGVPLRTGTTLLSNDPAHHPERKDLPPEHIEVQNILAVPYLQGGRVCGMLAVGNRPGGYGEEEREILEALTPTVMGVLMRKRAETALKESENLYRTLFEKTEDAFMLLEPVFDRDVPDRIADVRFVRVSQNIKKQTGITPGVFKGKTILEAFPDIEPYWMEEYAQAAHSRIPLHYTNYHGSTNRWYDMFCFPYGMGMTGILFRDVTAQKQTETDLLRAREELAQRATDRYQSLFQSIDEGFCILQVEIKPDAPIDYRVLEANAQYHLHTAKPPEIIGKSIRAAISGLDEYWYELFAEVAVSGNPQRRASLYCTPGKRWLDVYVFPAGETGTGLVAGLFRDVTERKRSLDILQENERLYRTVFENSQDGFALVEVVYDEAGNPADNRTLKINRAFEKMSGLKAELLMGKSGRELGYVPEPETLKRQDECLRTGKTAHFEEYNHLLERWFDIYVFPYGEGTVGQLFRDITRRKQNEEILHQSEQLYRKLFDNTEDGFMLCQVISREDGKVADMRILSVNKGWERQTGLKAEDGILEKPVSQIFQNPEKNWFKLLRPVAKTGRSVSFEEYDHYTDRWYDVRAFLYKEGLVGVLLRNITDRRRAEEALRDSQKKALRLVCELEEINKNKNEFINMLSHELRNPLAAISAGIQLLDLTKDEERIKWAREVIRRQMSQLCRLTDDLLDLTRISNNKIRLQKVWVELNTLACQAAEDYRALFEEKGVGLTTHTDAAPVLLEADPARLRQAIGNLLHNALKFTDNGGEALLRVSLEGTEALVTVSDNGLGIGEDLLPRLFEPFRQADASLDREDSGLGLGLSITRGIAQLHGGSVSAHSAGLHMGSTFCIRLPAGAGQPQPVSTEEAPCAAAESLGILVIEDSRDQADMLCMALREMGHRTAYATDGVSGLKAALSLKPDVVLCDIRLPGMNGYAVARAISSEPSLYGTMLVALTGLASDKYKKQAMDAGFRLHASKPVDMGLLKKMLANISARQCKTDVTGLDTSEA